MDLDRDHRVYSQKGLAQNQLKLGHNCLCFVYQH
ncbi:uncharacterized protein METZ01_LOCUS154950, partial [marine metagenome]